MYPYLIQGQNITVVIDNKIHTINKTHMSYTRVVEAIKKSEWDKVKELIDVRKAMADFSQGMISIAGDDVYYNDAPIHSALSTRIIEMFKEGFNISHMAKFMENLMSNPSKNSIEQLYGFLDACSLPITPDGCFLAYKKIKGDWTDCHTGKINNSIGTVVTMNRDAVDDNPDSTCSSGLHFCSLSYLKSFYGDRVIVVKINPKDVVSIPSDYNNSKGRCCRYEVISEIDGAPEEAFTKSVQENANNVVGQEYDSKGRPLSMTPNAIRKRAARAKAKAKA